MHRRKQHLYRSPCGNSFGGHGRCSVLASSGIGHEQAEWEEWTDCNVIVVQKIFLGQRKAVHDRVRLGDILAIEQEDCSAAIATRIPFTNLAIEIELHGLPRVMRRRTASTSGQKRRF
jgi:hypothetical protein